MFPYNYFCAGMFAPTYFPRNGTRVTGTSVTCVSVQSSQKGATQVQASQKGGTALQV